VYLDRLVFIRIVTCTVADFVCVCVKIACILVAIYDTPIHYRRLCITLIVFYEGATLDPDTYMEEPLSESHLCLLAQAIGHGWKMIGVELGVPTVQLQQFQAESQTESLRIFQMLRFWRNKTGAHPTLRVFQAAAEMYTHDVHVGWDYIDTELRGMGQNTDDEIGSSTLITESDIGQISPDLGKNWELVGPQLAVPWTTISRIRQQHSDSVIKQITHMLCEWRNNDPTKATFSQLLLVLRRSPSVDCDLDIVKDLMESSDSQEHLMTTSKSTGRRPGTCTYYARMCHSQVIYCSAFIQY
jgi:hypothetical protein